MIESGGGGAGGRSTVVLGDENLGRFGRGGALGSSQWDVVGAGVGSLGVTREWAGGPAQVL